MVRILMLAIMLLSPLAARAEGDAGWRFSLGGGLGFENGGLGIRGEANHEHAGLSLGLGYPSGAVVGLRGYLDQGAGFFLGGELGWAGTSAFTAAIGAGYRAQWAHLYLEAGLGIATAPDFPSPERNDHLTLPNIILGAGWRF